MFPNQIKVSTLLALFELYMLIAGHLFCAATFSLSKGDLYQQVSLASKFVLA